LTVDPWDDIEGKYIKDKEYEGEVVKLASYGALVRLEMGVEGLIHISKLGKNTGVKEGLEVSVYIESIDVKKRKISLGLVETDKTNIIYK
jgi:ribosomal protein S1